MLATGILHEDGGVLGLGRRAERDFGRKHFGDLVVSFSSPMLLLVMFGRVELGAVHPLAVTPSHNGEPVIILLSGRSWRVLNVDWPRRRVAVVRLKERVRHDGLAVDGQHHSPFRVPLKPLSLDKSRVRPFSQSGVETG